jgi:hypothetical protein
MSLWFTIPLEANVAVHPGQLVDVYIEGQYVHPQRRHRH